MLKVVKIDTSDYEAVWTAFIQNFGDQTNNLIVITDFTHMKQRKDKTVQQFFTRIGEIAYNYDVKKPHEEIMGPLWAIPEEHEETLAAYAAMPVAARRLIQRLSKDISMEVVKLGTTDMYQAFLTAHAYETALRDKQGNGSSEGVKISEVDAEFEDDEEAQIEAIKCKFQQKRMFCSNNGSVYQ